MSRHRAAAAADLPLHGSLKLPAVTIDSYNGELRDSGGFVGDRASGRAFRSLLETRRVRLRAIEKDPIGRIASTDISKRELDRLLVAGDVEAAGVVLGTVEDFAQSFAWVVQRFLRLRAWKGTGRLVVGGGLRASRIGELAIGRTSVLLKERGYAIDVVPIRHDPDEAGLLGSVQLVPPRALRGYDGMLGVDIGGANIRVGIVKLDERRDADLAKTQIWASKLWRHADDDPGRDDAVDRLLQMLAGMTKRATKDGLRLLPVIGIGCPGEIRPDGSIKKGGQNLPGDWEHRSFNLPHLVRNSIARIDGAATSVIMHNDAVVQGLSEAPFMRDIRHWGVMTIGSGLGNAHFKNRRR